LVRDGAIWGKVACIRNIGVCVGTSFDLMLTSSFYVLQMHKLMGCIVPLFLFDSRGFIRVVQSQCPQVQLQDAGY
jgi:hypothetical protein